MITALPASIEKAIASTSALSIWDWLVGVLGSTSNPIAQYILAGLEQLLQLLAPNALASAKSAAPATLLTWLQTLIAEAPQIIAIAQTVIAEIEKFLPKS